MESQSVRAPTALVLFSGGIDSLACIAFYRAAGFSTRALFVNYGQLAASREEAAVARIADRLQIELTIVEIKGAGAHTGCIPGRNALLLATSLMAGGNRHLDALGIHRGTSYPDCTPAFVEAMQRIYDLYASGSIQVAAPFLGWTKAQIWSYISKTGYPVDLTYSCELGLNQPCGHCATCADLVTLNAR